MLLQVCCGHHVRIVFHLINHYFQLFHIFQQLNELILALHAERRKLFVWRKVIVVRRQDDGEEFEQSVANQVALNHAISLGNIAGQKLLQDLRDNGKEQATLETYEILSQT